MSKPLIATLLVTVLSVAAVGCHPAVQPSEGRRTTNPTIAVNNLNGRVEVLEAWRARAPANDFSHSKDHIEALLMRAQFLGQMKDYARAETLADAWLANAPNDREALLEHASVRSALHRFAEAEADLARAEKLGVPARVTDGMHAAILQATGRLDEAMALRKKMASQKKPDITSLGGMAVLQGERDELAAADSSFEFAALSYHDVSPFALGWLDFQRGLMWQRHGDAKQAQTFLRAAVDRLPVYATAVEHLAQVTALLGDSNAAIALLRPLLVSSDDPEYAFQLSELLVAPDQKAEAAALRARAEAGYTALVARSPLAFADHAAWMWMATDPQKSLALALQNLANRKTSDAYLLALTAAQAAHDEATRCRLGKEATALSYAPTSVRLLAKQSLSACK